MPLQTHPLAALVLALTLAAGGCSESKTDSAAVGAGGAGGQGPGGGSEGRLPSSFDWISTEPLITAIPDADHPILSVKDPSVVFFENEWHVFATTADENAQWNMVYLHFEDWSQAKNAEPYYLDQNPALRGYHAAPQVFYFAPQEQWYLIFQSGQPQYTTTEDLSDPESWVSPKNFFAAEPEIVIQNRGEGNWLDFWIICDDAKCHLFFTDDNGQFYRSETAIDDFPNGFGEPEIVIDGTKTTVFEGSATYRVGDTGGYLTLIEAFGSIGERYYRSFVADRLDGEWTPLAASLDNPFAARSNVAFEGEAWTHDISHGELLRDGYDQTLTIDPKNLRFLYQGVDPSNTGVEYFQLPYQLALLTYTEKPTEAPEPSEGPSVCDGATTEATEENIADFDNEAVSGWWASYDDTPESTNEPLASEAPGADQSSHALHFVGAGHSSWGANFGTTLGCTDTSNFDGVSFFAKGSSGAMDELHVIIQVAAALPVTSGGDCLEDCYSHPRTTITLTPDWVRYDVPFSEFMHPGWGVPAAYDGTIMGFVFESSGPDFDVWLDEISLYTESGAGGAGGAGGAEGQGE